MPDELSSEQRLENLRRKLNGDDPIVPRLTREQAAILSAYTGVLCGDFDALHEYVEKLFERPVWTHEMASKEFAEKLSEKAKPDFISICYGREVRSE